MHHGIGLVMLSVRRNGFVSKLPAHTGPDYEALRGAGCGLLIGEGAEIVDMPRQHRDGQVAVRQGAERRDLGIRIQGQGLVDLERVLVRAGESGGDKDGFQRRGVRDEGLLRQRAQVCRQVDVRQTGGVMEGALRQARHGRPREIEVAQLPHIRKRVYAEGVNARGNAEIHTGLRRGIVHEPETVLGIQNAVHLLEGGVIGRNLVALQRRVVVPEEGVGDRLQGGGDHDLLQRAVRVARQHVVVQSPHALVDHKALYAVAEGIHRVIQTVADRGDGGGQVDLLQSVAAEEGVCARCGQ